MGRTLNLNTNYKMETNWKLFSERYCKTQEQTPEGLAEVMRGQVERYQPEGFILAEAQLMDSSYFGTVVILPFGPNNTHKHVPKRPFSPRGLASDTSVAIQHIPASEVPVRDET